MRHSGPIVAAVLSLFAVPAAHAQELKARTWEGRIDEYALLRDVEIPPFRIDTKEMSLRADRAVFWTDAPSEGAGSLLSRATQFYAEGNVVFTRRDVETHKVEVFRAESFYLDLRTRKGYISDIRVDQRPGEEGRPAVTLRAKEARLAAGGADAPVVASRAAALGLPGLMSVPPGRMVVFDVLLSTCTFGDPHYHIGLSEAQVDWQWNVGVPMALGFFLGKPEDPGVGGNWVTVNIWGVPVFAWPSFYLKLAALSALPLERVQGGRTSRFGNSIETTWGVKITKGLVDWLNPLDGSTDKDDEETWGRLRWEIDWRQNRGWAGGIDPSWKWDTYWGYLDTYYMRDDGPDPDNDFDVRFLPLERRDRGRARFFHRHDVTPHFRYEAEVSWLSDRNFLEEIFEKEFKEGKEQETVGYLRYLDGNKGGFIIERHRINDFQTQVEFLPKAKAFLANEPAVPGMPFGWTFSEELEIVNQRLRFDDALGLPDEQTWRFDSLSSWILSIPLGVATLSPFAEARVTAWEEALDGDPADRFIATAGARLSTDIHGIHRVKSDFLGLHDLRHILHLEARAVTAFSNTLEPAALFPYDAVDGFDDFTEFSFEIRNRFQTKVIDGQEFRTRDYLEFGAEFEYYPDAPRDTVGFKASNFSYPFNWITLGPHDPTKILDERDYSNVHWDVLLRPTNYLEAKGIGEYNPVHDQEEVREFTVSVRPTEGLVLSVGQVFVFDVTNAFTFGARWDLTDKWRVTADAQYDYKTNDFINRKATVGRNLHDFQLEFVFEEDAGRDERRFYVTFLPTFLRFPK